MYFLTNNKSEINDDDACLFVVLSRKNGLDNLIETWYTDRLKPGYKHNVIIGTGRIMRVIVSLY